MKAVKLKPKSPIRVGGLKGFESYDELIHSDTIFGAVANAIAYLNLDINEFIEKARIGEIRISSAFPYRENELFFPPPVVRPKVEGNEKDFLKKYRKSFLRKDTFENILKGESVSGDSTMAKIEHFAHYVDIASVTLDRITKNSALYIYTVITLKEGCGLYVLVDSSDGDFKKFIKPAFKLLADEGIGGNRTTGFGHFDFEVEDVSIKSAESEYFVTLSLAVAERHNLVSYDLIKRGGYVFSRTGKDILKPLLFMLREGSVVRNDTGKVLDIDDYGSFSELVGHKVFVYAKVFPAGISDSYFEGG